MQFSSIDEAREAFRKAFNGVAFVAIVVEVPLDASR
jgi:hypothetical protein